MGTDSPVRLPKASMEWLQARMPWLALSLVMGVFILLLYPSLAGQRHDYQLGDIADRDVKAPHDFFVEDREATEASRQQAIDQVLTVYDYDPLLSQTIYSRIQASFTEMRRILAGFDVQQSAVPAAGATADAPDSQNKVRQEREDAAVANKEAFEQRLGIDVNKGAFKLLATEDFSPSLAELAGKIVNDVMTVGVVANKEQLLKEADHGIILRNVANQTEKTAYTLRQYYGPDQAKSMVRIVAEPLVKNLNYNLTNLMVDICQRLLQPNITLNRNETEQRKKDALAAIKPIMYKIKAGEMLLREGERVTPVQLLKLRALNQQEEDRGLLSIGVGAVLMLLTLLIVIHVLCRESLRARMDRSENILFMTIVLVMVMLMVKAAAGVAGVTPGGPFSIPGGSVAYALPAASGAMLVCLFLGFDIALPFSLAAAVTAGLLFGKSLDMFLFFFISSAMGAFWIQRCRDRRHFISAGAKLGVLNIALATAATLYAGEFKVVKLGWDWAMGFLGGLGSGVVTVGMAPMMEILFHYTTDITLLELSNLDQPILRQLMLEAPGTYHHSVVVGSLVEAAASEIGANPLLAKVCGYYHDIGKVKKPLYFIENQLNGRNKHDKLAPSMSSLILIAHVKEGVDIARKNKMGQDIVDAIQQHHGTSLISYFYEKAKQLKGGEAVKIEDFRYPGPKPQTKEIGLVMLADVVEAASRALENPTPARIQGMVQTLINKIFFDGQLDNCELTLKDLHSIAKSFIKILNGIHHHRIDYAETAGKENSKSKNGGTDRESTGKPSHRDAGRSKESPNHLKRLGLG